MGGDLSARVVGGVGEWPVPAIWGGGTEAVGWDGFSCLPCAWLKSKVLEIGA